MFFSLNITEPSIGLIKPANDLPSVDLPQPLSPTSASTSPGSIPILTPSTALT